ncbi:hypothetical protein GCM10009612_36110 [Streptomyces beijiangensis]
MQMSHEARVDDGDPLTRGRCREKRGRVLVAGGGTDVETQRPQIAFERRPGYRSTGEDCGRQTDSLLGKDMAGGLRLGPQGTGRHVGRGYRMNSSGSSSPVYALLGPGNPVGCP